MDICRVSTDLRVVDGKQTDPPCPVTNSLTTSKDWNLSSPILDFSMLLPGQTCRTEHSHFLTQVPMAEDGTIPLGAVGREEMSPDRRNSKKLQSRRLSNFVCIPTRPVAVAVVEMGSKILWIFFFKAFHVKAKITNSDQSRKS